jgi:glycosyltransferase involved in cell wall biosynthesis
MRIALVSTCAVATPPTGYGGTELVIAELAREYVRLGHDVTVYATADSACAGRRRALFPRPVWPPCELAELRHVEFAWRDVATRGFDVVHVNQAVALPFARFVTGVPVVHTIHHDRWPAATVHYHAYPEINYVAISRRQAELVPEVPVRRVIYHGLDPRAYPAGDGRGGYAAFVGRFAQEKAPHLAIDAAVRAGVPLRLAGRPHHVDHAYHAREVEPRLQRHAGRVWYVGELVHEPKAELLCGALALLFPIDWEEPFGLVMIEAMLAGTPVIAFPRGAAPEVIDDGVTGYLVRKVDEMAARLRDIDALDRGRCRQRAIERFSAQRMASRYLELYEDLAAERAPRRHHHDGADGRLPAAPESARSAG